MFSKKNESLFKENYRSVNVLTVISKIFERILADQLMIHFYNLLSVHLSAFRKGYSCQHTIPHLTEYWRRALDEGQNVGTIAMDLSKAFGKMPRALLIAKLHAYNVTPAACNLIISYLKNRLQRVKVQGVRSEWTTINRGVPQVSVLGPSLFNIFINDLFVVPVCSNIVNYADNIHICYKNKSTEVLCEVLRLDTNNAICWFEQNYMDANPNKFQGIILDKDVPQSIALTAQDYEIPRSNHLKVLGVTLDDKLKFDIHIDSICFSASRQINALKRLSKFLDESSRVLIYKAFVLSTFSYSPITWIFCGKRNSPKLERLQERALRFVFSDFTSTYEELLKRGNFLPLSIYRLKFLAIEVYKCLNNLNPPYPNDLFIHNKANLRDLIAATGLVILLKLDSNRRFFAHATLKFDGWPRNIIRHVFYTPSSFNLCIISDPSGNSNWRYSPKTANLGQIRWIFFSRVTFEFDIWPWKTTGHLFYSTSSFVHHFVAIDEFKLELQSGYAQFGWNLTIFRAVWPWNLIYDLEKQ